MYESQREPLIPPRHFLRRLMLHFGVALALIVGSLGFGIWGYMQFEGLGLLDAFLNAAMLLGGMGPLHSPVTVGGKLFAGIYALYAGLVFIVTAALLFTPLIHRVLHRLHMDEDASP
jgi:hypothetical protein